ncbi:MAG: hypothetical protein HXY18_12095 [Bryobacteraceae bacterium]|nr:hypothetical protein [Bryobacteraceae bacterium]
MRSLLSRRAALALPLWRNSLAAAPVPRWRAAEIRRFAAPEARQAVAAGQGHLYAIDNHAIAKYEKTGGKRLALYECEQGKPFIHLNSGIVRDNLLHCAHSNYPAVPMLSSIETWDTGALRHVGSHSCGIEAGSATWVEFHQGFRYVTFAHYANRAAEPNRDPRWTALLQFDHEWRRLQGWAYPAELVSKLGQYSISGGVFHPSGVMLCTGHDNPEIYVLGFPAGGSTLVLHDTIAAPIQGQGIALDPTDPAIVYAIDRAAREIIVLRLAEA